MNIIFGVLPDVLFFTIFLIFSKNIKEKRIILFILLLLNYLLSKSFLGKTIAFNIFYTFGSIVIIKILYSAKVEFIDIFLFSIASIIITLVSILSYLIYYIAYNLFRVDYMWMYMLDKIILFIPLIMNKNKLKEIYMKYRLFWNRETNPGGIKSLSLRIISLICTFGIFNIIQECLLYIT